MSELTDENPVDAVLRELQQYQLPINQALSEQFNHRLAQSEGTPGDAFYETDRILAKIAGYPGKRIRGALAWDAYKSFGGQDDNLALHLATTFETGQMSLLTLDDVMDESEQRRGHPTVQVEYMQVVLDKNPMYPKVEHLANSLAITAGFILVNESMYSLADLPTDDHAKVRRAMKEYARTMADTGYGQEGDLLNGINGLPTLEDIKHMYAYKTARYTFVMPLVIGAAMADATDGDLESLRKFGLHAGVAYQIHDDILGMFGDPSVTGKPDFSDLQEGKMTVIMRHVLENASHSDREFIRSLRGIRIPDDEHRASTLHEVRSILRRVGAEKAAEEEALAQVGLAKAVLDANPQWHAKGVDFLRRLMWFAILRKS